MALAMCVKVADWLVLGIEMFHGKGWGLSYSGRPLKGLSKEKTPHPKKKWNSFSFYTGLVPG